MSFTALVVIFGVFAPLAAIGGASLATRFGGRRARRALEYDRWLAESNRLRGIAQEKARIRGEYCRAEANDLLAAARAVRLARFVPDPETPAARGLGDQFDAVVADLRTLTKGLV